MPRSILEAKLFSALGVGLRAERATDCKRRRAHARLNIRDERIYGGIVDTVEHHEHVDRAMGAPVPALRIVRSDVAQDARTMRVDHAFVECERKRGQDVLRQSQAREAVTGQRDVNRAVRVLRRRVGYSAAEVRQPTSRTLRITDAQEQECGKRQMRISAQ